MRRSLQLLFLVLSLFSIHPLSAQPLDGIWKGKLHRHLVYETRAHRAVYEEDLDLTLLVGEKEVSGHGTAHLSNPIISRTHYDPRYAQWVVVYNPPDFGFSVKGARAGEGHWLELSFIPSIPVKAHFRFHDTDGSAHVPLDVARLASQSVPWTEETVGRFRRRLPLSSTDVREVPVDIAYFGEPLVRAELDAEGGFQKIIAPSRHVPSRVVFIAFLACGMLVWPGMIIRPSSAYTLAVMGALLGTLGTLTDFGQGEWVRLAQPLGWAIAILIEALELSRLFKRDSSYRMAFLSIVTDIAVFLASFLLVNKGMDMVVTSMTLFGRSGAVAAAVLLVAAIPYLVKFRS